MSATSNFSEASYYRARYYDPSVGRFLSEDPITFVGGNNFYGFVNNRPIGLSDPMGLSPADVQRIQALCKKCTQDMVDQGGDSLGRDSGVVGRPT